MRADMGTSSYSACTARQPASRRRATAAYAVQPPFPRDAVVGLLGVDEAGPQQLVLDAVLVLEGAEHKRRMRLAALAPEAVLACRPVVALSSAQSEMRRSRMVAYSLVARVVRAMPRRLQQLVGFPPGLRMGWRMLCDAGREAPHPLPGIEGGCQ